MISLTIISVFFICLVKLASSKIEINNKFVAVRNKPSFVDKTPFIYEFLQNKYLFISAPSKFGKSTNLDMLNLFLSNHRSKQTIENHFIWTRIWDNKDFVKNHLGEYPVVYFNLKVRGYSNSFDQTLTSFKISLYNAFSDHSYLYDSEKLDETKIKLFEEYSDLTRIKLLDTEHIARGLGFLVEVLHQYHGKPVVLLADEFGTGITEGILTNHKDLRRLLQLYSSILNYTFINQDLISHALLTGESSLLGVESPILSTIEKVGFMQRLEFSRFYGLTYNELENIMPKHNISTEKRFIREITEWYCGYTSPDGLFRVCNPYSTIQYLQLKNRIVYWTGSSPAADLISKINGVEGVKEVLYKLVMRDPVAFEFGKETNTTDVKFLSKKIEELPQYCENYFLQVLFEAGFLTFDDPEGKSVKSALRFPNEEVRSAVVQLTI